MGAREFDHVSEPVFGIDGLGQDDVGPGDRVHHAKRIENLGECSGKQHCPHNQSLCRAACSRRLHEFLGHTMIRRNHDRQQIHEDTKEQEGDFLPLVYAEP